MRSNRQSRAYLGDGALGKGRARARDRERGHADAVPNGGGHGLIGMKERVSLYGGSITSGPRQGGGFVVTAHLPLEARA